MLLRCVVSLCCHRKLSKLTAEAYKAYGRCVIKLIAKALGGVKTPLWMLPRSFASLWMTNIINYQLLILKDYV